MEEPNTTRPVGSRELMVEAVEAAALLDDEYAEKLVHALMSVDISSFFPDHFSWGEFVEGRLPVSLDRTSLPLPVMIRMLGILAVEKRIRVLEVGCGNGLMCALLSILGAEVFGVEKNASLIQRARKTLDRHHLEGVLVRRGSSASGWAECGPYDRVLVSLPQREVDPLLLNQLVPEKGRLVALEGDGMSARLVLYEVSGGSPRKVTFEEVTLQGPYEVTEAAN